MKGNSLNKKINNKGPKIYVLKVKQVLVFKDVKD